MKTHTSLLFLIVLSVVSCTSQSKQKEEITVKTENNNITNIEVLYYNYIFDSQEPISPESVREDIPDFKTESRGVLCINIIDSVKIGKIKKMMEELRPSESRTPVDARILMIVNYEDRRSDTICIGGKYTDRVYLNGIEQLSSNEFLFLVKNNGGYYPWIIGDNMFNMVELQDNSFPKEPFVSTDYYAQYQKFLSDR